MSMLRPSDLQRLSELEAAASHRGWVVFQFNARSPVQITAGSRDVATMDTTDRTTDECYPDAHFICEIRNSLPALLADLATLKKALGEALDLADRAHKHDWPTFDEQDADEVHIAELRKLL